MSNSKKLFQDIVSDLIPHNIPYHAPCQFLSCYYIRILFIVPHSSFLTYPNTTALFITPHSSQHYSSHLTHHSTTHRTSLITILFITSHHYLSYHLDLSITPRYHIRILFIPPHLSYSIHHSTTILFFLPHSSQHYSSQHYFSTTCAAGYRVAGVIQGAFWRSCCARRCRWPATGFRVADTISRMAGATYRASWRSCYARGRRWPTARFRVAGAIYRISRRSCAVRGRC